MNAAGLSTSLQEAVPTLFVCSPAPQEGVRVRTPMLYPDGGVVDVFVLERNGRYIVTDFGDTLGWLGLQSVSQKRTKKQDALIQDVCLTLRIESQRDQLMLRDVSRGALGDSVLRVAQAAVRVSDLWFTLLSQAIQTTADEVDEWLRERAIDFKRDVSKQGRSTQNWKIDFETHTDGHTCFVFILATGTRGAVRRLTEHVVAGCVDLSHFRDRQSSLTFVSLFDDTHDVWQPKDFLLVEGVSDIALWSHPTEFENLFRAE